MIESLENNEAVLLMYLAGELPPEDRAEVEEMLVGDARLRAELAALTAAWGVAREAIAGADEASETTFAARRPVVTRRIGRALSQEMVRRASKTTPAPSPTGLRYPWWFYPTASAAAILVAFLTWWGSKPIGMRDLPAPTADEMVSQVQHPPTTGPDATDSNKMANDIERVFNTNNDADNAMLALRDERPIVALDQDGQ